MAYRRRRGYKRGSKSSKRQVRTKKQVKAIVKSTIAKTQELKYLTYTIVNSAAWVNDNGPGIVAGLGGISYGSASIIRPIGRNIAVGTNYNQRIGRKIVLRGFQMNFQLSAPDSFSVLDDLYNTVRILIVEARGSQASPYTGFDNTTTASSRVQFLNDVFGRPSTEVSGVIDVYAPVDFQHWKTHYDKVIQLRQLAMSVADQSDPNPQQRQVKFFKKLNRTIKYNQNGLAVDGQNIDKPLFLIMCSDSAAAPNPFARYGWFREYYTEE